MTGLFDTPIREVTVKQILMGALALLLVVDAQAQNDLEVPVRITAAGAPIDVITGHAAPYLIDFDGDGVRDLLVGEYGEHEYPSERMVPSAMKYSGGFVEGRLRIYSDYHNPEPEAGWKIGTLSMAPMERPATPEAAEGEARLPG